MARSGPRLIAECEPQHALLLAWPFSGSDWHPVLAAIQQEYAALIRTVLRYQAVYLLVQPGDSSAADAFGEVDGLVLIEARYNDTWCRDFGPIMVEQSNRLLALDFLFDGWGGRYRSDLDNRINSTLARHPEFSAVSFQKRKQVLEGGAIDGDGRGQLLVNRYWLRQRMTASSEADALDSLRTTLGVDEILSIDIPPLDGDETDGHIDTLARWARPDCIAYQSLIDNNKNNNLKEQLHKLNEIENVAIDFVELPCPEDLPTGLPASYANFVLINHAVLVPAYGSTVDQQALERIAALFPDRSAESVDARVLIQQGGGPHCASMQIPALHQSTYNT